jgi:hypothetical protein
MLSVPGAHILPCLQSLLPERRIYAPSVCPSNSQWCRCSAYSAGAGSSSSWARRGPGPGWRSSPCARPAVFATLRVFRAVPRERWWWRSAVCSRRPDADADVKLRHAADRRLALDQAQASLELAPPPPPSRRFRVFASEIMDDTSITSQRGTFCGSECGFHEC